MKNKKSYKKNVIENKYDYISLMLLARNIFI